MNRRKSVATKLFDETREFMKWTEDMDERLLNAMIKKSCMRNKVDNSWIIHAYNNIFDNLHQFGYVGVTKNNVKNRQNV